MDDNPFIVSGIDMADAAAHVCIDFVDCFADGMLASIAMCLDPICTIATTIACING
jgi:hypothetical protein